MPPIPIPDRLLGRDVGRMRGAALPEIFEIVANLAAESGGMFWAGAWGALDLPIGHAESFELGCAGLVKGGLT